jgi:hypothetical protein
VSLLAPLHDFLIFAIFSLNVLILSPALLQQSFRCFTISPTPLLLTIVHVSVLATFGFFPESHQEFGDFPSAIGSMLLLV